MTDLSNRVVVSLHKLGHTSNREDRKPSVWEACGSHLSVSRRNERICSPEKTRLQSIYMQEQSIHKAYGPFVFIVGAYDGLGQVIRKSKVIMVYEDTMHGLSDKCDYWHFR